MAKPKGAPRLFWKLYLSFAIPLVLALLLFGIYAARFTRSVIVSDVEARISEQSRILSGRFRQALNETSSNRFEDMYREIGLSPDTRLTLIMPDGQVVFDSQESFQKMENHHDRPEILEALASGSGKAVRYSHTLHRDMMYFARRVGEAGQTPEGVLRLAVPINLLSHRFGAAYGAILAAGGLTLLLALLFGFVVVMRATAPLTEMTNAAHELLNGNYGVTVRAASKDEIGLLGRTLNRLSEELQMKIHSIQRDRNQYETMMGAMVEGVIVADGDDRLLYWNREASFMFNIHPKTPQRTPLSESVRVPEVLEMIASARKESSVIGREIRIFAEDRELTLDSSAIAVDLSGEQGVVAVFHDTTELKRLEKVRQDFVANASHELKTPLTAIQGYAEILLDDAPENPGKRKRYLEQILSQGRQLSALVQDLLTLSKIESGEKPLQIEALMVQDAMRSATDRHQATAKKKNLNLKVESKTNGLEVLADSRALDEVLDNLIDNAIKYTPTSGKVVARWWPEKDRVKIEIQDTGVGIPRSEIQRIFERFYRVDKARSRDVEGTGLGLSIVKHLITQMNGTIQVESEMGHGSSFCISLPAVPHPERGRA